MAEFGFDGGAVSHLHRAGRLSTTQPDMMPALCIQASRKRPKRTISADLKEAYAKSDPCEIFSEFFSEFSKFLTGHKRQCLTRFFL
jgi:hypothetical protein